MIEVTLTEFELELGALVGVRRQIESIKKGCRERLANAAYNVWQESVEGALGEMAFAKAAGHYWQAPVNTFKKGGDVGDVQIRTRSRDDYDLIVRPYDRDADVFVLVTGRAPTYRVIGYISGGAAKEFELKDVGNKGHAAHFVPAPALEEINTPEDIRCIYSFSF